MTYRVIPRHVAMQLYDELAHKALAHDSAFPDEPPS
jgi:hypothetical protein